MCLFELCELEQAERELDLQEAQAREQRLPFHTRTLHLRRATIATLRGRYEEAERTAQDCLRSGQEMNITAAPEGFGAQLISIRRDQGRVAEIDPVVKLMTQRFPETPVWRAGYSLVCTELERLEEAREWFDAVIRDGVDRISRDVFWLPAIAALADTCWYIRDATAAASLYVLLMPYKGRLVMGSSGMICWGFVDRLLGLLAGVMQHHELACRHLEESIALHKRGQALPWLARSQLELAELLVGDGTRGDAPRARTLATESRAVAQSIGMRALEGRTERLLDQLAL
jgi:tetratricopeptide (TPR) repeat protein